MRHVSFPLTFLLTMTLCLHSPHALSEDVKESEIQEDHKQYALYLGGSLVGGGLVYYMVRSALGYFRKPEGPKTLAASIAHLKDAPNTADDTQSKPARPNTDLQLDTADAAQGCSGTFLVRPKNNLDQELLKEASTGPVGTTTRPKNLLFGTPKTRSRQTLNAKTVEASPIDGLPSLPPSLPTIITNDSPSMDCPPYNPPFFPASPLTVVSSENGTYNIEVPGILSLVTVSSSQALVGAWSSEFFSGIDENLISYLPNQVGDAVIFINPVNADFFPANGFYPEGGLFEIGSGIFSWRRIRISVEKEKGTSTVFSMILVIKASKEPSVSKRISIRRAETKSLEESKTTDASSTSL